MGVPGGREGRPNVLAFEVNPAPGTTVTVRSSWLFCIGCCIVIFPCPLNDPSIPSPFNSVTSHTISRQMSPALTVVKANARVRPFPTGIWSTAKSFTSAFHVPSPFIVLAVA